MDYITGPFQYGFMVRALVVSVLVGIMCPILGAYVITRGRAFMGDALAHSVLPGMVIAFLLGISPFFAAVPAGILIALLMGSVSRRTGISEDTSIGIIFAGMFALGLVMLSRATNINVNIEDLLLGQVLGVSQTDVYISLGLTVLVLVGLYAFHRQLVYTTFDEVGASVVGIKTNLVEYVLLALLALVIVIGIQAAGNSSGNGDAHHARGNGVPAGKAFRRRNGDWGHCRSGVSGGRTLPLLPRRPAIRAGNGSGSDTDVRRGGYGEKEGWHPSGVCSGARLSVSYRYRLGASSSMPLQSPTRGRPIIR